MRTNLTRIGLGVITALTLTVTACTPKHTTPTDYPPCSTSPSHTTCIKTVDDQGNGWGFLIHPDGSTTPVNIFSDGEVEIVN